MSLIYTPSELQVPGTSLTKTKIKKQSSHFSALESNSKSLHHNKLKELTTVSTMGICNQAAFSCLLLLLKSVGTIELHYNTKKRENCFSIRKSFQYAKTIFPRFRAIVSYKCLFIG